MSLEGHLEVVRRFYEAGPSDDDGLRREFASSQIVWHVPGSNRVSGTYRGARDVFEVMPMRMQPLDEWVVRLDDVMANADLVVAVVHISARRGPHRVESRGAHVFRFDDAGLIAEAWGFVKAQTELDRLFDFGRAASSESPA